MSRWTCPICRAVFLDQSAMKDHALLFHRDHDADVAAVLPLDDIVDSVAGALQVDWDAQPAVVVRTVRADAEVATNAVFAALSAAGYAVVKLPEGIEVEHGARLERDYGNTFMTQNLFRIVPPRQP